MLLSIFSPFIPFGLSNLVSILNPTRLNLPPCQCRWESQQCMASLPIHPPMRLAGFLSPPERRKPEKHVSERHPPLLMLMWQGTSQQWTDTLAGSRERSNSHELSMCTQRASLYRRAVRPRRLQPTGMGKNGL